MEDNKENVLANNSNERKIQQKPVLGSRQKIETYLGLVNDIEGSQSLLEFDLITARQKGEEIRYLSISLKGINTQTTQEQDAFISVDKEAFERIKEFFTNLSWNS